jgi:hypothetical protein
VKSWARLIGGFSTERDGDVSIPTQEEEFLLSAYRNMTDEARQNLLGIITALPRK